MSTVRRGIVVLLLIAPLASSAAAPSSPATPPKPGAPPKPELTPAMRAGYAGLVGLLPYLASAEKFRDPRNHDRIRGYVDALGAVEHAFGPSSTPEEPGIVAVAGLFHARLASVRKELERDPERARARLRTVTAHCFACHSRVRAERDFEDVSRQVEALSLPPLERADFLAATRQFDAALAAYRELLARPVTTERDAFEQLRALRRALGILVRVKADAAGTSALLDSLAVRPDLAPLLKAYVEPWRAQARSWTKEKLDPRKEPPAKLVKRARELLARAGREALPLPDPALELDALRASALLHEALGRAPAAKERVEALYWLGVAYASVQDPLLHDLDGLYLEACIREAPHTKDAARCHARLSDRIVLGYTGSSGTHVPDDELERLETLRALAAPK